MFRTEAKRRIETELERGHAARREGYEGRARVCARRAAGEAIREYLALREPSARVAGSAFDLLAYLRDLPYVSEPVREVAGRMLNKVDEDFHLPADIDLLADAVWLANALEGLLENG